MRSGLLFVPAALALAMVVPLACSDFDAAQDTADASPVDAASGSDGAADAAVPPDAALSRAKTLYVFGGGTSVALVEKPVFEAYAASILADGSLGAWERAPALDVGRLHMATIAVPNGPLVIAGGNGVSLGEDASANFTFARDDVSVTGGDPLASWTGGPALGAGKGRWAAHGTFAAGQVFVGGGFLSGDAFTDTVFAADVTGTPLALQPWRPAGNLPVAAAHHRLVALGSRLYAIGGAVQGDGGETARTETSMTTIGAGGMLGPWEPAGNLPFPRKGFGVLEDGNRVFVIGGHDGASPSPSVLVGLPEATQRLTWQESTPMKHMREHACVVRANGLLYVLGGSDDSGPKSAVEVGVVSGTSIQWRETTALPGTRSAFGCMAR